MSVSCDSQLTKKKKLVIDSINRNELKSTRERYLKDFMSHATEEKHHKNSEEYLYFRDPQSAKCFLKNVHLLLSLP